MISVLSDDFALAFSLTINCSELIFPSISSSWQLLPTLAICLINVEYLFRLTYALNLGLSQDWFFIFFLTHRESKTEFVSFKLPYSWCWSFPALWYCREGWRETEISSSGMWDTLKIFFVAFLLEAMRTSRRKGEFLSGMLKAVSALAHISGLKRPL